MVNVLGRNIRKYRNRLDLTQAQLAGRIGVSESTVRMWELGKNEPDLETIWTLSRELNVPFLVLLGSVNSPAEEHKHGIWINVLGDVAAGIPIEAVEDIVDQEEITLEMAEQGEHFALRLKGSSMEPRMHEGDVVIVRKQEDVDDGDVCVVLVNGNSAMVKRIRKRSDGIVLIPFNPAFEPQFFSNAEIASLPVTVLGKVVELRGKFN